MEWKKKTKRQRKEEEKKNSERRFKCLGNWIRKNWLQTCERNRHFYWWCKPFLMRFKMKLFREQHRQNLYFSLKHVHFILYIIFVLCISEAVMWVSIASLFFYFFFSSWFFFYFVFFCFFFMTSQNQPIICASCNDNVTFRYWYIRCVGRKNAYDKSSIDLVWRKENKKRYESYQYCFHIPININKYDWNRWNNNVIKCVLSFRWMPLQMTQIVSKSFCIWLIYHQSHVTIDPIAFDNNLQRVASTSNLIIITSFCVEFLLIYHQHIMIISVVLYNYFSAIASLDFDCVIFSSFFFMCVCVVCVLLYVAIFPINIVTRLIFGFQQLFFSDCFNSISNWIVFGWFFIEAFVLRTLQSFNLQMLNPKRQKLIEMDGLFWESTF